MCEYVWQLTGYWSQVGCSLVAVSLLYHVSFPAICAQKCCVCRCHISLASNATLQTAYGNTRLQSILAVVDDHHPLSAIRSPPYALLIRGWLRHLIRIGAPASGACSLPLPRRRWRRPRWNLILRLVISSHVLGCDRCYFIGGIYTRRRTIIVVVSNILKVLRRGRDGDSAARVMFYDTSIVM